MNHEKLIYAYYLKFLKREPDDEGLAYYMALLKSGNFDEKNLEESIKNSKEYRRIQASKKFLGEQTSLYEGKFGLLYNIRASSLLDKVILEKGIFEESLIIFLQRIIPTNGIIFDVGANVGLLTVPFAKLCVPNGIVHSFEPNSSVREILIKNIEANQLKNVVVRSSILQNNPSCDKMKLYRRKIMDDEGKINDGMSSIFSKFCNDGQEIVSADTIDNYVKKYQIPKIDFIKIDAQGADFMVLEGASKVIEKYLPTIMYEHALYYDKELEINNSEQCFHIMESKNYVQFPIKKGKILDRRCEFESNDFEHTDMICFHESRVPNKLPFS